MKLAKNNKLKTNERWVRVMAYRPLENTFVYRQLNSNGKLSHELLEVLKKGEYLTKKDLEEQFLVISKNFKYPLKFRILDEVEKGKLIMIYSPPNVKLPLSIPFFLTKNESHEVVGVVCVDLFGTKNKQGTSISIETKKLYTLLEAAYFAKLCYYYPKQISSRNTVITNGSLIYSNMILRVFNKKYALNIDKSKVNKLLFLASKFYMINLLGLGDNETTRNYALKSCVAPNKYVLDEVNEIFKTEYFTDFSTFISGLKNPDLGFKLKDLQVRGFLESYIAMYESAALMGLESFPYFFYNVLAVTNGAYMNNQYILEDIVDIGGAKIYTDLMHIEG